MHDFFSFKYVLSVLIIYSLLQKRVVAGAFKGLFWGTCECKQTWRKAKCNVSTGLIQLKKAKQRVELKGKRTWKWEAGGGCAWGDFTSRKARRMQIRVLSQFNFKLSFRSKRTYSRGIHLAFGILWNARPGEFLKLFVHKGTQQLACLVIIQGGCLTCPPKQSHNCSALSLFPGYHSFPKWAIVTDPSSKWVLDPDFHKVAFQCPFFSRDVRLCGSLL